jgi:hypothetical protein
MHACMACRANDYGLLLISRWHNTYSPKMKLAACITYTRLHAFSHPVDRPTASPHVCMYVYIYI